MSAEDNLSKPLFHGTGASLSVGDIIKPSSHKVAHATSFEHYASTFAEHATKPESKQAQGSLYGAIYTVEPVDPVEMDKVTTKERLRRIKANKPEESAEEHIKFSKKGFRVTGLSGLMPNVSEVASHELRKRGY